jgi:1-acyl-sn-glycerol-3-phosphate acyltransferase
VSDDLAWARSQPAGLIREAWLSLGCRPLIGLYARRNVRGLDNLADLQQPVIFVANHSSHLDTPLILRALPFRWRRRTGMAAAADYFYKRRAIAAAVSLGFNTVPVDRAGDRLHGAAVLDEILDQGWSVVVFAEGTRSRDGTVGALQSGAAVLATRHELPIVPVYVCGTRAAMPPGKRWMHRRSDGSRHDVRVTFGPAIPPRSIRERREVMDQVRLFFESQGATTTPNKRLAA